MTPFEIALREFSTGVAEVPGSETNPRIAEYLKTVGLGPSDETSWCSAFINWCCEQAQIVGSDSGAARSWLSWGRATASPRVGDVVVLWRGARDGWQGHVGFYVGATGGAVILLGGNQGDRVSITTYSNERILGFRTYA